MVSMNRLSKEDRIRVIAALCEGNSIRSTVRMTGVAKNTVAKLLVELGTACAKYQDEVFRGLRCERVQADEIWAFVGCKQKNVTPEKLEHGICGDVWTWTAICADSKLVFSWMIGQRDAVAAHDFMLDVADRLANRVQLTTDGHKAYLTAVKAAFGNEIDYAMLVKIYGESSDGQKRYSPAVCVGCEQHAVSGSPAPEHVSTSYAERQNLTMRMSMRRFTRLTNGFSKKVENHVASLALYFFYYNFVRVHQTLKTTPCVAAGVTNRRWDLADMIGLLDSN